MPRITEFVKGLSECERAEITLGLSYVVDDDHRAFVVPAESLDLWRGGKWFGRKDVELQMPAKTLIACNYTELVCDFVFGATTVTKLSAMLLDALACFETHQDSPWYLAAREHANH